MDDRIFNRFGRRFGERTVVGAVLTALRPVVRWAEDQYASRGEHLREPEKARIEAERRRIEAMTRRIAAVET